MTYVLVLNGVVVHCVSVNDLQSLQDCYPNHLILERVGSEHIGWLYNGTTFTQG